VREVVEHPAHKLIDECKANGVMLDFVILQSDTDLHDYSQHEEAAIGGMATLAKRTDDWVYNMMSTNVYCAYYWTVFDKQAGYFAVIGASSTD